MWHHSSPDGCISPFLGWPGNPVPTCTLGSSCTKQLVCSFTCAVIWISLGHFLLLFSSYLLSLPITSWVRQCVSHASQPGEFFFLTLLPTVSFLKQSFFSANWGSIGTFLLPAISTDPVTVSFYTGITWFLSGRPILQSGLAYPQDLQATGQATYYIPKISKWSRLFLTLMQIHAYYTWGLSSIPRASKMPRDFKEHFGSTGVKDLPL